MNESENKILKKLYASYKQEKTDTRFSSADLFRELEIPNGTTFPFIFDNDLIRQNNREGFHITKRGRAYMKKVTSLSGKILIFLGISIKLPPVKEVDRPEVNWGKWSVIVAISIFILGLIANYVIQKSSVDNSITVDTTEQTGDNIIVGGDLNIDNSVEIRQKVGILEPNISIEPVSLNIPIEVGYQSEFMLIVDAEVAVKNLYVQANTKNIVRMDIIPQRTGAAIFGHSGIRDEYAFNNISSAYGNYKVRIVTKEKQEIKFEFSQEK